MLSITARSKTSVSCGILTLEAIQKLRKGQRGEGADDFLKYRYVYFEGEGRYFMN